MLVASDSAADLEFGAEAGISNSYAIVTAGLTTNSSRKGEAYIFERDGAAAGSGNWTEVQKVSGDTFATPVAHDGEDMRVAIDGNYAILGKGNHAHAGLLRAGSAHIYERDSAASGSGTWTEVQMLTASTMTAQEYFGHDVDISGNYAIIGTNEYTGTGRAYIFERDSAASGSGTWTQEQELIGSAALDNKRFGLSVGITTDYAIVGNPQDTVNGVLQAGSVYIFKRTGSTWTETQIITAADPISPTTGKFGAKVAIDDNYAIVSAGYPQDRAYILQRTGSTWTLVNSITASDASHPWSSQSDFFACDIDIMALMLSLAPTWMTGREAPPSTTSWAMAQHIFLALLNNGL